MDNQLFMNSKPNECVWSFQGEQNSPKIIISRKLNVGLKIPKLESKILSREAHRSCQSRLNFTVRTVRAGTDRHTHTHTHRHKPITVYLACACAPRHNNIVNKGCVYNYSLIHIRSDTITNEQSIGGGGMKTKTEAL